MLPHLGHFPTRGPERLVGICTPYRYKFPVGARDLFSSLEAVSSIPNNLSTFPLFINNCATTSIKGIQEGVKKDLDLKDSKAPASLGDRLKVMSKEDEHSIRRITYNEIKKEFNLHGAGTKW